MSEELINELAAELAMMDIEIFSIRNITLEEMYKLAAKRLIEKYELKKK